MKKRILLFLVLIRITSIAQDARINLSSNGEKLQLLAEGTISTFLNERDFAISPDGSQIYFTISTPKSTIQTIVFCKRLPSGKWTQPEVVPFAGNYSDLEPAFTPDGKTIYFSSNRPVSGDQVKDFDIWRVTRKGSGWGEPENLGQPINTAHDEFYPSVTRTGSLYFTAQYKTGPGKEDIYVAKSKDNTFQKPVALDSSVNSKYYEFNAFVSPDESYILFTSYGRSDDTGGGDLYISVKGKGDKWMPAQNIKELNSPSLDYCPYVSPDEKVLFITSERHALPVSLPAATYQKVVAAWTDPLNGSGNIYNIDFSILRKYFPQ